jgi:hypothetical protein
MRARLDPSSCILRLLDDDKAWGSPFACAVHVTIVETTAHLAGLGLSGGRFGFAHARAIRRRLQQAGMVRGAWVRHKPGQERRRVEVKL